MDEQPVQSMEQEKNTTSTSQDRKFGMDMTYVKSINGLLKGKIILWSFIAMILSYVSDFSIFNLFFGLVVTSGFVLTVGLFFIMASDKAPLITRINIYLFDFAVSVIGVISYFIVCMVNVFNILSPTLIAASILGFIAMASFFVSIHYNFKRYRSFPSTKK